MNAEATLSFRITRPRAFSSKFLTWHPLHIRTNSLSLDLLAV
jgi:hypothetical protein